MPDALFAIPGEIDTPTGGYIYDKRVLALLPTLGVDCRHVALPGGFPAPSARDLTETERILKSAPQGALLLIDGLAYGAMPAEMIARLERPIFALVHHPLHLEAGLGETRRAALFASEKAALALARHVIVTSRLTARLLTADFGVPAESITVAEPGTDPAPRASGCGSPMQLLAVGAISPRKGYDVLIDALAPLASADWRLIIVGATDRAPEAVSDLKARIAAHGLGERVRLAGKVVPDTLERLYDTTDIFIQPSLFEGYGMVLAEAMARGLAIVCTTGGAAAETVPDGAALKVPPGDAAALGDAIRRAMTNKKLRKQLETASWDAGRVLPTWHETTRRIAASLMGLRP
jgi:glycosyltransferase involved in cell wall biosynthesis